MEEADLLPLPLAQVYSEAVVTATVAVMNGTATLTLLLGVLLVFLIVKRSPREMGIYKHCLLVYTLQCLVLEVLGACAKPVLLLLPPAHTDLLIFRCVGWVAALPGAVFQTFAVLTLLMVVELGCCFSVLVLERLLAITVLSGKFERILTIVFVSVSLAMGAIFLLLIAQSRQSGVFVPDSVVQTILRTQIKDGDAFLAQQKPNLMALDLARASFLTQISLYVFLALETLLTVCPLAATLFVAQRRLKRQEEGGRLRQIHLMLIRCSLVQFAGFLLFIAFPIAVFIVCGVVLRVPWRLEEYVLTLVNAFQLYDMACVLYVIKPYRLFVLSLFSRKPKLAQQTTVICVGGPTSPKSVHISL